MIYVTLVSLVIPDILLTCVSHIYDRKMLFYNSYMWCSSTFYTVNKRNTYEFFGNYSASTLLKKNSCNCKQLIQIFESSSMKFLCTPYVLFWLIYICFIKNCMFAAVFNCANSVIYFHIRERARLFIDKVIYTRVFFVIVWRREI